MPFIFFMSASSAVRKGNPKRSAKATYPASESAIPYTQAMAVAFRRRSQSSGSI